MLLDKLSHVVLLTLSLLSWVYYDSEFGWQFEKGRIISNGCRFDILVVVMALVVVEWAFLLTSLAIVIGNKKRN